MPNVRIGDNSIIGANSTVSKDILEGTVAVGSPAKAICSLNDYIEKNKKLMIDRPCYGEEYTLRKDISEEMKDEMKEALYNGFGFVK